MMVYDYEPLRGPVTEDGEGEANVRGKTSGTRGTLVVGVPGSGKSTFAAAYALANGYAIRDKDAYSIGADGAWHSGGWDALMGDLPDCSRVVIVAPLLTVAAREKARGDLLARGVTVDTIIAPDDHSTAEAIARNAARPEPRRLSDAALGAMLDAYEAPEDGEVASVLGFGVEG